MAVTLYRCSKCRGLFNSVFGPNNVCRDCKFQQAGFQPEGGGGEIIVVEPDSPIPLRSDLCNVVPRNDGFNFAVVWSTRWMTDITSGCEFAPWPSPRWMTDILTSPPACNKGTIAKGKWHPAGKPDDDVSAVEVFLCPQHAEELRVYVKEPGRVSRGWFEEEPMGGKVPMQISSGQGFYNSVDAQVQAMQQFPNVAGSLGSLAGATNYGASNISSANDLQVYREFEQWSDAQVSGGKQLRSPIQSAPESDPHAALLKPSRKMRISK